MSGIAPLADSAVSRLRLRLGTEINLRRDLYQFVSFVRREGLKRSHRGNRIPKGAASKLAKILSFAGERAAVEEEGAGLWSDAVSHIARQMGLVRFDVKGVYLGYQSSEPAYPDNEITVDEERLSSYLASSPVEREQAVLSALIALTPSEFFEEATLIPGARFDSFGCAVGPASRMDLPSIRRGLLELWADLPTGVWLPTSGLVDLLRTRAPKLILPPELREEPLPEWELGLKKGARRQPRLSDLYSNFRERTVGGPYGEGEELSERTPNVFTRVEGRYLQFFLQEIPFLCGFVDLALGPEPKGKDVIPPLEPVRAVRLTPRLRQVFRGEAELSRVSVTVLPTFEVLVEAPSYPDRELEALLPFCSLDKEDGPTHLFRLEREAVLKLATSERPGPSPAKILERQSGRPLPANVAAELRGWGEHAQKLTLYEGLALVELRGQPELAAQVRAELGKLVVEDRLPGFLLVREPDRVETVLEKSLRVPIRVAHRPDRFAKTAGALGTRAEPGPEVLAAPQAARSPVRRAQLSVQDLVGYRTTEPEILPALHELLEQGGSASLLVDEGRLLLVPAADLQLVRAALRRLGTRFEVDVQR
jgi:hypothetical protein